MRAPETGVEYTFDALPDFSIQAATLVRRIAQLDLLAHLRDDDGIRLAEWDHLPEDVLDAETLQNVTAGERLRIYPELPDETLDAVLKPWNVRWYVDPSIENATVLPFILSDLGLVLLPEVASAFGDDPGANDPRTDPDDFEPFVGWFGDSPPPHAFQAHPCTFENELGFVRYRDTDLRRVVVVNDVDRAATGDATAERFRERPSEPLPVEIHHEVTRADLAELLSSPTDVLHFVGACDGAFECPDGALEPATVDDVGARLLVLDGRGSTAVGETMIERGAVASVVRQPDRARTLSTEARQLFFDLVAAGVRLNFARLAAERYAPGNVDLGVIGDGLARISGQSPGNYGYLHGIEPIGDGRFVVEDYAFVKRTGYYWRPDFPDAAPTLKGGIVRNTTDAAGVKALVHHTADPIVYDGRIYWPDPDELFYPLA